MGDVEPKKEKQKKKRRLDPKRLKRGLRCDLDQYEMLKRCSEKRDMTEWNEWRRNNRESEVLLEGAVLVEKPDKRLDVCSEEYLKRVCLQAPSAFISDITLGYFKKVDLAEANMKATLIVGADLEGAILTGAHLEGAEILGGNLAGVDMDRAYLQGARFCRVVVNGQTSLYGCRIDRKTQLEDVALQIIQVDPGTTQLLQYNIRRMNWKDWYKEHWFWHWAVRAFWAMSDYGRSTLRVVGVFFILALLFALIYWLCPSCVLVNGVVGDIRGFVHALYFSVVTMTTLGFGDIAANPDSWEGQILLMIQVILGYVLLGALITRFAVLFTAGGPAGSFAKEKKKNPK
jgi:Uncharacterized low-complexity proteins